MSFAPLPDTIAALSPVFHNTYDIVEECGVGGSAFVLKVRRRVDSSIFAAKIIARDRLSRRGMVRTRHWGRVPPGFKADEEGALVVPVEAYVLRRIRHPGVVAFVDLFADERYFYLIQEFHGSPWRIEDLQPETSLPSPPITPPADRTTFPRSSLNVPVTSAHTRAPPMRRSSSDLFECVEMHRNMSEATAQFIFLQVVATVYDLAQVGLVHRDIKDENAVATSDCRVKLIDFGSCVMYDPSQPPPIQHEQHFFGTCTYAAPEVLLGLPHHMLPAEVWSLGILLHVLLTGEHPFRSPADATAGNRLPIKVRLSPAAYEVLGRCLSVDPEQRISLEKLRSHPWVIGQTCV
ncbi:hypothetical protein JCM11641_007647 [Rhodosporidiobolus odoratus]